MATSIHFPDEKTYLENAIKFLNDNYWIFEASNTTFLSKHILDKFPTDWIDCLMNVTNAELNDLPFGCFVNVI